MRLVFALGPLVLAGCGHMPPTPARRSPVMIILAPVLGKCDLDAYLRVSPPSDSTLRPIHEDSLDTKPSVLRGPPPVYPDDLRRRGIQGRAYLAGVVRADSLIYGLVVVSTAHPGLVDAAASYLHATRFRPGMKAGRAVPTFVCVPIDFRIGSRRQTEIFDPRGDPSMRPH